MCSLPIVILMIIVIVLTVIVITIVVSLPSCFVIVSSLSIPPASRPTPRLYRGGLGALASLSHHDLLIALPFRLASDVPASPGRAGFAGCPSCYHHCYHYRPSHRLHYHTHHHNQLYRQNHTHHHPSVIIIVVCYASVSLLPFGSIIAFGSSPVIKATGKLPPNSEQIDCHADL